MITMDDAKLIAAEWRGRFGDEAAFEESWQRYFSTATVPDVGRLDAWLRQDQQKDAVKNAGIVREPLLPVRQHFELSECQTCRGLRYVRHELPVGHPDFGKAVRCPSCNRS